MRITSAGGAGGTGGASTPYLYLPGGWDTGWKAAKAASGTTPCWITAIGDSISAGQKATSYLTQGFTAILRDALQTAYGKYADFYNSTMADSLNLVNTPPLPWTFTGGSGAVSSTGFSSTLQFSAAGSATFVTPKACTALDLFYHDVAAGSFTWTVDGGSATTVTQTLTGGVRRISLGSGLANTTHTVVFTWVSGLVRLAGAGSVYGTTGIGCGHVPVAALQSQTYLLTGDAPQGNSVGRATNQTAGYPSAPHLLMLEMGVNDIASGNVGPDQWFFTYQRLIRGLRRSRPAASIVIVSPAGGNTFYGDGGILFTNADQWINMVAAHRRLAEVEQCAHLNIDAKWGSTPVAQGFVTAGDVHPTIAGHADIGAELVRILV